MAPPQIAIKQALGEATASSVTRRWNMRVHAEHIDRYRALIDVTPNSDLAALAARFAWRHATELLALATSR